MGLVLAVNVLYVDYTYTWNYIPGSVSISFLGSLNDKPYKMI